MLCAEREGGKHLKLAIALDGLDIGRCKLVAVYGPRVREISGLAARPEGSGKERAAADLLPINLKFTG